MKTSLHNLHPPGKPRLIMVFGPQALTFAKRLKRDWCPQAVLVADYPARDTFAMGGHAQALARAIAGPVIFVIQNACPTIIKLAERWSDYSIFASWGESALVVPKSGDAFSVSLAPIRPPRLA